MSPMSPAERITELLERHDVPQVDFAAAIGLKPFTLNKKLKGTRRWSVTEAIAVCDFFKRFGAELTVGDLFGEPRRKRARKVAA